jgi:hypothetical protein
VRSELELAAAERLPQQRRVLADVTAVLAAAIAAILALANVTWTAVRAVTARGRAGVGVLERVVGRRRA